MAGGSQRKKPPSKSKSKRSVPNLSSSPSPMAPRSPPALVPYHKRISILVSISLIVCVVVLLGISSNTSSSKLSFPGEEESAEVYSVEVVNEYPHDPNAFTQGLLYAGNDTLFESTGLHGKSSVRKVDLKTGKVEALERMDDSYFGEGLTMIGERLYQVTWLTKTGFIYERNNLSKVTRFTHLMSDGWGLATDGKILFGSDGTSTLYQIDPQTMKVLQRLNVSYKGLEVHLLNELEYIYGEIWANVWQTDCIARISPSDGSVLGWIVLPSLRKGLLSTGFRDIDVLNGIAWDKDQHRIFVTGKHWPKLYEIKVHPVRGKFNGDIEQLPISLPAPLPFGQMSSNHW
ncbi:hypothetical protein Droror1_Dr00013180 [Drosera rotundifolia]